MKTFLLFRITFVTLLFAGTAAFSQVAGSRTNPINIGDFNPEDTYQNLNNNTNFLNQWASADYSAFTTGRDVTYKINITQPQSVRISTDYTETNFDTYLHIVKLNTDGSFNSYVSGNDDIAPGSLKSLIQINLCPGLYGIIVEGFADNRIGNYRLRVESLYIHHLVLVQLRVQRLIIILHLFVRIVLFLLLSVFKMEHLLLAVLFIVGKNVPIIMVHGLLGLTCQRLVLEQSHQIWEILEQMKV